MEQADEQFVDELMALARATPVHVPPAWMAQVEADALRWLPPAGLHRAVRPTTGWRAWWARATSLPKPVWPTALACAAACGVCVATWIEPVYDDRLVWQDVEAWAWEAEVHDAWVAWDAAS